MTTALATLEEATRMLAECRTVDEAKKIRDLAEAARVYAREADLGQEAMNHAAEIKLRAERRAGEVLDEMVTKGLRKSQATAKSNNAPSLDDLGIEPQDSSRWQKLADADPIDFESYIAEAKETGTPITASRVLAPLMSSNSAEWYTPPDIIERALAVLGGTIDLDPCAEPAKSVPALRHYTAADDGLSKPWHGHVYMNPPYGNTIGDWIAKLAAECAKPGHVTCAIALVPARTDTKWWRVLSSHPVCFIEGRLRFSGHENGAPFPSAVFGVGIAPAALQERFGDIGLVYDPVH